MASTSLRSGMVRSWGDSRVGYQPSWSRIPVWSQCHTGGEWTRPVNMVDYIVLLLLQLHVSCATNQTSLRFVNQTSNRFPLKQWRGQVSMSKLTNAVWKLNFYSQGVVVLHYGSLRPSVRASAKHIAECHCYTQKCINMRISYSTYLYHTYERCTCTNVISLQVLTAKMLEHSEMAFLTSRSAS